MASLAQSVLSPLLNSSVTIALPSSSALPLSCQLWISLSKYACSFCDLNCSKAFSWSVVVSWSQSSGMNGASSSSSSSDGTRVPTLPGASIASFSTLGAASWYSRSSRSAAARFHSSPPTLVTAGSSVPPPASGLSPPPPPDVNCPPSDDPAGSRGCADSSHF